MDTTLKMLDYIQASPSPYHCVQHSAELLEAAGFSAIDERAAPADIGPGDQGYIARGGTLVAWRAGRRSPTEAGFRLVGAHTDSPNLRVKPVPDSNAEGYRRLGVETYGGVLLFTWLDRDLGLSGRVMVEVDGRLEERLFRTDEPIARIPNLAIHLNRTVNSEGFKVDKQRHLAPVWGMSGDEEDGLVAWLSDHLGGTRIVSWDLMLHDVVPPTLGGLDKEFVYSARLDNQASCFQALQGLARADAGDATQVIALFDHEEVGSRSQAGAMGHFLRDVLVRLERDHTERAAGGLERAVANSFQVSVDMAHAIHPNYADVHEPKHKPALNGGPVIKTHSEQRYATDGATMARFRRACQAVDVPCQDFVIRTDLACGSTIGPISASLLGIPTVDVGNAMLSMHSVREQCGAHDPERMVRVLSRLLQEPS